MWSCECFNFSATTANTGMLSRHEVLHGTVPLLKIVPFFQPGIMRVERASRSEGVPCFCLNDGYNHSSSCANVINGVTGGVCMAKDGVWTTRRSTPVLSLDGTGGSAGVATAATPSPVEDEGDPEEHRRCRSSYMP